MGLIEHLAGSLIYASMTVTIFLILRRTRAVGWFLIGVAAIMATARELMILRAMFRDSAIELEAAVSVWPLLVGAIALLGYVMIYLNKNGDRRER